MNAIEVTDLRKHHFRHFVVLYDVDNGRIKSILEEC